MATEEPYTERTWAEAAKEMRERRVTGKQIEELLTLRVPVEPLIRGVVPAHSPLDQTEQKPSGNIPEPQ